VNSKNDYSFGISLVKNSVISFNEFSNLRIVFLWNDAS
jgi:hypothetical protein